MRTETSVVGHPPDWTRSFRLGDACQIRHGYAFKGEFMTAEEASLPIVVNIVNFQYAGGFRFDSTKIQKYRGTYPREYELRPGEILVVMTCQTPRGEILGIPGRIPNDGRVYLHNQRMGLAVVKDRKRLDPGFLYYLFLSPRFNQHLFATASGAKILHTSPGRIEDYEFALPPISTQRHIAAILSAYDDLIDNNTRRIKILEDMAQMIYREWFVKFRFPGHEGVKMVDSPLGRIPEGWDVVTIQKVSSYIGRGVSPRYDDKSSSIVINQKCIRGGKVALDAVRTHSTRVPGDRYVQFGDVMVNSTGIGTLGRVAQVYQIIADCTVDSHVTIVRPNESVGVDYFGFYLSQMQEYFDSRGTGATGQTELARGSIGNAPFLLPALQLRLTFAEVVTPLRNAGISLLCKNNNLRSTRDLLLPRLVSGEVEVPELEINRSRELAGERIESHEYQPIA